MTYIRNPRQPFVWESDGEYSGKFKSDDGTLHDSPKEADMHDRQSQTLLESESTNKRRIMDPINELFAFHILNQSGKEKASVIACKFHELLCSLEALVGEGSKTREFSITKTKLEEACFFAKKSIAVQTGNQE